MSGRSCSRSETGERVRKTFRVRGAPCSIVWGGVGRLEAGGSGVVNIYRLGMGLDGQLGRERACFGTACGEAVTQPHGF